MVAVATISSNLDVLNDFTSDRTKVVGNALAKLGYKEGTATPPATADTVATDEAQTAGRHQLAGHVRHGHVQQRRPAARAEGAGRDAGADRAEEVDPLFQRRHAAQRRRQPGRAARGDQRRRPRARVDLSGRHARPAGGRARRRRDPRQRPRHAALLGRQRARPVHAAAGVAGHAWLPRAATPVAAPSSTRTTSRPPSSAFSATCRPTT